MSTNNLELTGVRPPSVASVRPSSSASRPRSGYHVIKNESSVDELLFTSHHPRLEDEINFSPPWSNTARDKTKKKGRPLLWAPADRTSMSSQSTRTNVLRHSNRQNEQDGDKLNKYRPIKYTASYCDETLFGPKLEEPSFESPWAEKTKKPKPFLFSAIDYTKLVQGNTTDSDNKQYSSSGTLDGRPPSRQGRRPASASTRPVTVESMCGKSPVWKP